MLQRAKSTLSDERRPSADETTSSADRRTIRSWAASSRRRTRCFD